MGRNVTLLQMRTKVEARYDLPTDTSNTFVNTTIVNEFINSSIASYTGILQECELEEYYTYEDTITSTPGQAWVATSGLTSAQFQGIRHVHWIRGTDDAVQLERAQNQEWFMRSWSSSAWDSTRPRYCLIRDRIYLMPPPIGAMTLRVFYTGIPNDLTGDSDTFYAGPGWEEWIVADVCWKVAEREDQDPSRFITRRQDAERLIRAQYERETGGPVFAKRLMFSRGPSGTDWGDE